MKQFFLRLRQFFNHLIERIMLMTAFERIETLEKQVADLTAKLDALPLSSGDSATIAAVDAKADAIRADLGIPTPAI